MNVDRYVGILAAQGLQPFHREPWVNPRTELAEPMVLGERPAVRWRVSPDELERLVAEARAEFGNVGEGFDQQLLGFPIAADDALPPSSVILEPIPIGPVSSYAEWTDDTEATR